MTRPGGIEPDEWDRRAARQDGHDLGWTADMWPDSEADNGPDTAEGIMSALNARSQIERANRDRTAERPVETPERVVRLTPASDIPLKVARWLWTDRIPVGEITLLPGREGIGKSLALAWLSARITRGQLPGVYQGQPRAVIYAATEDSWSHTIGPRLVAAGADLDMVFRADVLSADRLASLTLPLDIMGLFAEAERRSVAMLACDPLQSLISSTIDTHKDHDLRTALEPLKAAADRTGCAVVGLAHFNKSAGTDALNLIMGSRGWSAMARAVIAVARDPNADDGSCVMTQAKSNLGPVAPTVPSLRYVIRTAEIPTPEGPASVGVLTFTGESDRHVGDILAETVSDPAERAERDQAAEWLADYLHSQPAHEASRADVLKAAKAEGYADATVKRARVRANVVIERTGFPARSVWRLDHSDHEP